MIAHDRPRDQAIAAALSNARKTRATGGKVTTHVGPIHSPVAGRTDHLPMHVPNGSFVVPADIVSHFGEGNSEAGFKALHRVFGGIPYGGKGSIPYAGDNGPYGMPLPTKAEGGDVGGDDSVPIVAAGGEYVIPPERVLEIGEGDMDTGHRVLDQFVIQSRKELIDTLKGLAPPRKN